MASILVRVFCVLACATALADEGGGSVVWGRRGRVPLHCPAAGPHLPLVPDGGPAARPDVTWWRDGEELPTKGASLKAERPGVYRCGVRSAANLVLGVQQTVRFASLEKRFAVEPADTEARAGQPAALGCRPRSAPAPNVTWLRDGLPLAEDDRHYVLDSGDLLITDVSDADAGNYSCVAFNSYVNKTRVSRTAALTVAPPAALPPALLPLGGPRELAPRAGGRLLLACPALGEPPPQVEWRRTGQGSAEELAPSPVLLVPAVERRHEGEYTCSVRGHPHLTQSWSVRVLVPARITAAPVSIHKPSAGVVRFDCAAEGAPDPEISWYKNGEPLQPGGRVKLRKGLSGEDSPMQLVIGGAQPSDAGVYQCFAHSAGTEPATAWAVLGVAGGALPGPAAVRCRPRDLASVQLDWRPVAAPAPARDAPPAGLFYTVSYVQTEGCVDRCTELIKVDSDSPSTPRMDVPLSPLVPYQVYVRAYFGKDASKPSHKVLCRGQGVPVKVVKDGEAVSVRWGEAAAQLPQVVRWRLQHRPRGAAKHVDVTLERDTHNYTLPGVATSDDYEVRLLATTTEEFPTQDLSLVNWTSTLEALAASALPPETSESSQTATSVVPSGLTASSARPRALHVSWRCDACESSAGAYSFVLCYKRYDPLRRSRESCVDSDINEAEVGPLEPDTEYQFRVQALLQGRRGGGAAAGGGGGPFSDTLRATTLPDESRKIKTVNYTYLDDDRVLVWWTVYETGADDNYTVQHSQNLTRPVNQWAGTVTGNTSVELSGLDHRLKTYVIVSVPARGDEEERGPVMEVPPRASRAAHALSHYMLLGVIAGAVVTVTCLLCCAALCVWTRRKNRLARMQQTRASAEEDGTEMTSVVSGPVNGERRGADEPLLNGYAHGSSPRNAKPPNGRYKRAALDDTLDMTRRDDTTLDTILEADTTDTSHTGDARDTGDTGPRKLPDDNMNSQPLSLDRESASSLTATLPPNG